MITIAIILSDHAYQRMKERNGLSKKAALRLATKAFEQGLTHAETTGNLFKFLVTKNRVKKQKNLVYGDKVYCFAPDEDDYVLITILQLPANLLKLANTLQKKKHR